MREIVFDTETTGLDKKKDRVIEVGCVELVDLVPTGEKLHLYINPQYPVSKEAFAVHGLSNAFLRGKPIFSRVADSILDFFGDDRLVAHNAPFDIGFLNAELGRLDIPPLRNEVVDTLALSKQLRPGARHTLDALCSAFNVDRSHRTLHGALLDSELLAEVYVELCGGRQFHMGLQERPPELKIERRDIRPRRKPLKSRLSDEELQAHLAFIDSLGDKAVWRQYRTPSIA